MATDFRKIIAAVLNEVESDDDMIDVRVRGKVVWRDRVANWRGIGGCEVGLHQAPRTSGASKDLRAEGG